MFLRSPKVIKNLSTTLYLALGSFQNLSKEESSKILFNLSFPIVNLYGTLKTLLLETKIFFLAEMLLLESQWKNLKW